MGGKCNLTMTAAGLLILASVSYRELLRRATDGRATRQAGPEFCTLDDRWRVMGETAEAL